MLFGLVDSPEKRNKEVKCACVCEDFEIEIESGVLIVNQLNLRTRSSFQRAKTAKLLLLYARTTVSADSRYKFSMATDSSFVL